MTLRWKVEGEEGAGSRGGCFYALGRIQGEGRGEARWGDVVASPLDCGQSWRDCWDLGCIGVGEPSETCQTEHVVGVQAVPPVP